MTNYCLDVLFLISVMKRSRMVIGFISMTDTGIFPDSHLDMMIVI